MNITELRDELAVRAAETDERHDDLLPGVRRKITTTKRRRTVGGLAGVVTVAVVAVSIVPNLTGSDSADPIDNPPTQIPSDVTQNGITFPGVSEGDLLQQAFVSKPGESSAEFIWTPTSKTLTIRPMCSAPPDKQRSVQVFIEGLAVASQPCSFLPGESMTLSSTDTLWLRIDVGKPAEVKLQLIETIGGPVADPQSQVGVGLYTTGPRATLNAMPSTPRPSTSGDYEKDGIRYRGTVGGDVLEKAVVGDRGQTTVMTNYFPSTADLEFRVLCLAEDVYNAALTIDGKSIISNGCGPGGSTDAGTSDGAVPDTGKVWPFIRIGDQHTVMLRLEDRDGRPVRSDQAQLAFGIYQQGPFELIDGTVALPNFREHSGYEYELTDWRTVPATSKTVTIDTPAGTPYLLSYGSTPDLGAENVQLLLTQKKGEADSLVGPNAGIETVGRTARAAGTATLRISRGKATKGTLLLAIYTPVR